MAQKTIYRTWPALQERRPGKRPTEYQITTYKLPYHFTGHDRTPRLELDPEYRVVKWYERYRERSSFRTDDWDAFEDPNQVVYWRYNIRGDDSENFVDFLLEEAEREAYDRTLPPGWVRHLRLYYGPFRYPYHALQMMCMYVAQMAPASSITNCLAFEAMDNLRVVQRIAYRVAMLGKSYPDERFGADDQARWEGEPVFQPLRECVERAMTAYDWGEGLAATNLVVKPLLDEVFLTAFGELSLRQGDHVLADLHGNFSLDSLRTRHWVTALARFAIEANPDNRAVLDGHVGTWFPLAWRAVEALAPLFEGAPSPLEFGPIARSVRNDYNAFLAECGLAPAPGE